MTIEITPELLNDLRQKAEAYDLKEWVVDDQNVIAGIGYNTEFIAETIAKPDAEYIAAASPAVMLALVAEVERLNKRFDEQKLLATRMIEHAAEQKIEIDRLNDKLDELICSGCNQQPKFCVCELLPLSGSDQRG